MSERFDDITDLAAAAEDYFMLDDDGNRCGTSSGVPGYPGNACLVSNEGLGVAR